MSFDKSTLSFSQPSFGGSNLLSGSDPFSTAGAPGVPASEGKEGSLVKIERWTGAIAGIWSNVKPIFTGGDDEEAPLQQTGDTQTGGDGSAAGRRVVENIWDTIKNTAEAAFRGGAEGAVAASEGGRRGSALGGSVTGLNMTLILAGGLALVLFLRK